MPLHNRIGETAVKDHLLKGNPLTSIETSVLFGVSGVNRVVSRLRKMGFRIETRKVTYALALRRINEFATLQPPPNLPIREIFFTEYRLRE